MLRWDQFQQDDPSDTILGAEVQLFSSIPARQQNELREFNLTQVTVFMQRRVVSSIPKRAQSQIWKSTVFLFSPWRSWESTFALRRDPGKRGVRVNCGKPEQRVSECRKKEVLSQRGRGPNADPELSGECYRGSLRPRLGDGAAQTGEI